MEVRNRDYKDRRLEMKGPWKEMESCDVREAQSTATGFGGLNGIRVEMRVNGE